MFKVDQSCLSIRQNFLFSSHMSESQYKNRKRIEVQWSWVVFFKGNLCFLRSKAVRAVSKLINFFELSLFKVLSLVIDYVHEDLTFPFHHRHQQHHHQHHKWLPVWKLKESLRELPTKWIDLASHLQRPVMLKHLRCVALIYFPHKKAFELGQNVRRPSPFHIMKSCWKLRKSDQKKV